MPIEYIDAEAKFLGIVTIDEVENLGSWLQTAPNARIDLGACTHLHPAALQVLMAGRCHVIAWPEETDLRTWLTSALQADASQPDASQPEYTT